MNIERSYITYSLRRENTPSTRNINIRNHRTTTRIEEPHWYDEITSDENDQPKDSRE